MLQRYKLRLGDGTVLLVDRDGLETWRVDNQAAVQAGSSGKWVPLRKFLALAKAAEARRARREEEAARDGVGADELSRREEFLPLTPPPPREGPADVTPLPREEDPPPPPPQSAAAPEPPPTPPPADEGPPLVTPPAEDLPAVVPPAVDVPAPSPLAGATEDEVSLVIPRAGGDEIAPASLGPSPAAAPPGEAAAAHVQAEPRAVTAEDPLAHVAPSTEAHAAEAERAAAAAPVAVVASEEEEETTVDLSSLGSRTPPRVAVTPVESAPPVSLTGGEAAPPPVIVPDEVEERVKVTVGPARVVQSTIEEPSPLVAPPAEPAFASTSPVPSPAPRIPAAEPSDETATPVYPGEPPGVQSLADEPSTRDGVVNVTELPVVPLKDLPEEESEPGAVWKPAFEPEQDGEPERALASRPPRLRVPNPLAGLDLSDRLGEDFWNEGRAASVRQGMASLGTFISRCLAPINRFEKGQPLFPQGTSRRAQPSAAPAPRIETPAAPVRPLAEEPRWGAQPSSPTDLDVEGLPAIPLKSMEEGTGTSTGPGAAQRLVAQAREWLGKPAAWAARRFEGRSMPDPPLPQELPPTPLTPWSAEPLPPLPPRPAAPPPPPAPARPTAPPRFSAPPRPPIAARQSPWSTERTVDREVSAPPLTFEQLPVLPLASAVEAVRVEEVYDGDDGEGIAGTLWHWTRRLVVLSALAGGGVWAVMTFESWSPPAAEIGQATLTGIDGHVRTLDLIRQRREAVASVQGDLPHLSPERIRQLMVLSPLGLLDAKGVFEAAWVAAEQGSPRLPAEEARELEGLQKQLLEGLFETEREWLREYDRARFRGAVFPFEAQQAHLVYARGVRRLPPESQDLLRRRLDQAISLGLEAPEAGSEAAD